MFVLVSNHFWKCFSVNAGVWLRMENKFFGKYFQLTLCFSWFDPEIGFSQNFISNYFRTHAQRERERERAFDFDFDFADLQIHHAFDFADFADHTFDFVDLRTH